MWWVYLGQQLNTHTAVCSLPPPQWGRGENKSRSEKTRGLISRQPLGGEVTQRQSLTTSHKQTHAQRVPRKQPPWNKTSSRPLLAFSTPHFYHWVWHFMLWSMSLASLGQLSLLCMCPFPIPCLPAACSLQQGKRGRVKEKEKALTLHKHPAATAKSAVLSIQFHLNIQNTALCGLQWRKMTPSQPEPVQLWSSPGSKQAGPFPSRVQLWGLLLLSSHPKWGLILSVDTGAGF